jgi:hypothetical protein
MEMLEEIRKIDWSIYGGQDHFNPDYVPVAFEQLISLDKESLLDEIQSDFLLAIGNNHRGTYYPVTIQAIEFIVLIAIEGKTEIARYAALEILILIYCTFNAENENYKLLTREEIENSVDSIIESFKVKFEQRILDISESERNKETLSELLESIEEKANENIHGYNEE